MAPVLTDKRVHERLVGAIGLTEASNSLEFVASVDGLVDQVAEAILLNAFHIVL